MRNVTQTYLKIVFIATILNQLFEIKMFTF